MGIFDKIKNAIWGGSEQDDAPTITNVSAAPIGASAASSPAQTSSPAATAQTAPAQNPAPTSAQQTAAPTGGAVDIAAVLDAAVKANGQKLDWRKSIVDLMKALDLDSSLGARKELADELGFTGDKSDSASMNIWLHKQVIQKLKDNGGKVPADLL